MNFNLSLHFVTRKNQKKKKDNDELRFIIVFYNTKNNNNKNEAKFIYMHWTKVSHIKLGRWWHEEEDLHEGRYRGAEAKELWWKPKETLPVWLVGKLRLAS